MRCRFVVFLSLTLSLFAANVLLGDGPKDNQIDQVRKIPPPGVEVSADDRRALEAGLARLSEQLGRLEGRRGNDARLAGLIPDVQIFHRAVRQALDYQEFFAAGDVGKARGLIVTGLERAEQLLSGEAPWTRQTGLVVRGFVSQLDGTVQPYGLVIPTSYRFDGERPVRLDLWFHGRGETLSEVNFLDQRSKQVGTIAPADTIVLHPYGRYSNAFKLAGEVDVLEGLASVRERYRIDPARIVVRGFSMGGAGAWHMAVHYPSLWAAANPGAGFSETPAFLKSFQQETLDPAPYERTLWRLYDCTDWVDNLRLVPTVAYSGELDVQKQAADIMAEAAARQGLKLTHVIGPETKHSVHPGSLVEIERRLASIVERGRIVVPRQVKATTYTLKYPRFAWVAFDALNEHWQQGTIDARIVSGSRVEVQTRNVSAFTLDMPAGHAPLTPDRRVSLVVDGTTLEVDGPETDRSWLVRLHRDGGAWHEGAAKVAGLVKRPGLQGPIDDALMGPFLFVRPTGKPRHEAIGRWVQSELEHALVHWRQQMRGDARVVDDTALTEAQIAGHHLILWGDPASNSVLGRIAEQLPITWSADSLVAAGKSYPADHHAPVMIYPNPLAPSRYVVLNSSFTYREYDYLNNARQVPKLPDWGVIDVRSPVTSRGPGKVVAADFFDERWEFKR